MEIKGINRPHLILNFDINKTIILGDKSKKLDVENGVKTAIVDYAWGKYDYNEKNWILKEKYLSLKSPNPNLINYNNFMHKIYPYKSEEEIPDKNERFKKNKEIKKMREDNFLQFLNKGQPGEKLYTEYLEILKKLKISQKIKEEINKDNSKYPSFYKELYLNGYIFIFHSLFRLMIELQNKKRNFSIIFRTFGTDFDDVIKEFNSFCEGGHPIFNEDEEKNYPKKYFDGTHNSNDYRIKDNNIGIIYRFDENIENCYLILGTLERIKFQKSSDLYYYYKNQINEKKIKIIKGGKNIFEYITINSTNNTINSFCINDHYDTWFKYNKKSKYGKPMLIDPENKDVEVFFFDDNIKESETSIVDCRNVITGESIKTQEFSEKYLIIADTLKAAKDEYYFLSKIEEAEKLN